MSESVLVACPHCHALNRVPRERFDQGPSCGKCHLALFAALPAALSAESFDAHVMRAGLPVVVDFWAPWCGPCRMMAPHFEAAARQLEPRVRLAKLDTEAEPALGARHGIRSIPTMVLFHQGRELARHSGAMPGAQIVAWVRDHLPPA
jgi:thioredoxin 2